MSDTMNYRILGTVGTRPIEAMLYDVLAKMSLQTVYSAYLPWSNASLRPAAIQMIINDVIVNERKAAVEFGSGISTVFLSLILAQHGGHLITFDHDSSWQQHVRNWIPASALNCVTMSHASLCHIKDFPSDWYDGDTVRTILNATKRIDLLLVDGPPAFENDKQLARSPALSVVRPFLSDSATIFLDDVVRQGEKLIASEWSAILGVNHNNLAVEAGVAYWHLGKANNIRM